MDALAEFWAGDQNRHGVVELGHFEHLPGACRCLGVSRLSAVAQGDRAYDEC